jgi:hypothetical protein
MQTLEDLRAELPEVAVDHAVRCVRQDGLFNSLGEIVGASRAAGVRANRLSIQVPGAPRRRPCRTVTA